MPKMRTLHLRELLSTVAHIRTEAVSDLQRIRHVIAPFY
jgi:hypothetical protein